MSDNMRMVNTRFWFDGYIETLEPLERYVFLYLLTNPATNIAGVYELPIRKMSYETKMPEKKLRMVLDKFIGAGKIDYVDGWVIVRNFQKHQRLSGPKIEEAVKSIVDALPDRVSKGYRYPTNTPLSLSISPSTSSSDSEKPKQYGNPEVNAVIQHFEKTIDTKLPRMQKQRFAASTLIKRHGLKAVLGAINAAALMLGKEKKPQVYTVEDLRDKWKMLETHSKKALDSMMDDKKMQEIFGG